MKLPHYHTPDGFCCPECGQPCEIVPLLNDFGYAGTHCTGGRSGVHFPLDFGLPISNCCEALIENAEEIEYD